MMTERRTIPHRASGDMVCECGREYWRHPLDGPVGCFGERFLRRLCNGALVKL